MESVATIWQYMGSGIQVDTCHLHRQCRHRGLGFLHRAHRRHQQVRRLVRHDYPAEAAQGRLALPISRKDVPMMSFSERKEQFVWWSSVEWPYYKAFLKAPFAGITGIRRYLKLNTM